MSDFSHQFLTVLQVEWSPQFQPSNVAYNVLIIIKLSFHLHLNNILQRCLRMMILYMCYILQHLCFYTPCPLPCTVSHGSFHYLAYYLCLPCFLCGSLPLPCLYALEHKFYESTGLVNLLQRPHSFEQFLALAHVPCYVLSKYLLRK